MAAVKEERKISDNLSLTHENYLICKNVPIARIGVQNYHYLEGLKDDNGLLPADDKGWIEVTKPESVLFNKDTMDSFENKPVTLNHMMLSPENYKDRVVGTAFNIRRGEGKFKNNLMADLLIQDKTAIDIVKNKKMRQISCGYEASYVSDGKGKAHQTSIIGNHIAIVSQGKAGPLCRIYDSQAESERLRKMANLKEIFKKTFMQTVDSMDLSEFEGSTESKKDPGEYSPASQVISTADQLPPNAQASVQAPPAAPSVQGVQSAPAIPPSQQILAKLDQIMQLLQAQSAQTTKPAPTAQTPEQNPGKRMVSINPNNPMNM